MSDIKALGRAVRVIVDAIGSGLQISGNVVLLPGVAMLAILRWSAARIRNVPMNFGPWWSGESRGVPVDDGRPDASAIVYVVGVIALTGLGLVLLWPELIRSAVLGIPTFSASWQDDGILDSVIRLGLRDGARGLTIWFGLSFLVMSPLDSDEMGSVVGWLEGGGPVSRLGATVLVPIRVLLRLVEPLDTLGRIGIGAAWAAAWLWLASALVRSGLA